MRADEVRSIPVQYNYSQRVEDWANSSGLYKRIREAQRLGETSVILSEYDIPKAYSGGLFNQLTSFAMPPKEIREHLQSLGYTVETEYGYEWFGFKIGWSK